MIKRVHMGVERNAVARCKTKCSRKNRKRYLWLHSIASPSGVYELLWLFVHNFFCLITNVLFQSIFLFILTSFDSRMNIKWEVMGVSRAVDVKRFIINISPLLRNKMGGNFRSGFASCLCPCNTMICNTKCHSVT